MVAVSMAAAVTLLPALLGITKRRVNSVKVPFVKRRPAWDPHSTSARWTARVVKSPVRYGVAAAVVLVVLAIPVLSMRLAFADSGNDPKVTTTRKAYDLIAAHYGAGTNGPLTVVVDTAGTKANAKATGAALATDIGDVPGVASVDAPVLDAKGDLAIIQVTPTTGPQDAATSTLLAHLRTDVIPGVVGHSAADVTVTGSTALTDDVSKRLQDRMPWFLGAVIGLAFLVLMIVFRSVLVPLKAAVLNVLSVGAAYGVIVAVFQWGWGRELIGVHENVPIMPLAPMLMFAILFGLSMDYEVFLLSRVREQFLKHRDAKRAVIEGVGSTARVITSAALIMMAVFGAFVLGSDVVAKMFGVGLAVAVLLDVTLVRMVLVPAAMSLLGDKAWWLPRWLDRRLPHLNLEEADIATEEWSSDGPPAPHDDERDLVLV
jgi:putative drug exporter of the RND superfamily